MKRLTLWLPLLIFAVFVATVVAGLTGGKDETVPSAMIGKPVPDFALPAALPGRASVGSETFTGGPRLLNFFGSWCAPCIAEAPQLLALRQRGIPIEGIAVRDRADAIADFLSRHGDPFAGIGSDTASQVQFALGSSGVPETFVIDGAGIIRHQHIGPILEEDVAEIVAAWEAAR